MTDESRPIRVLYTIPNFRTAGSGRALLNIIRHLDRTRVQPSVAVTMAGSPMEDELRDIGVPVIEAPFFLKPRPRGTLPTRLNDAARQLRGTDADVWHSWHYGDDYTEPMIARLAGVRRWVFTKKNMAWRDSGWGPRSRMADGIVATNSDMLHEYFAPAALRRKTRLISRGVDVEAMADAPPLDLRTVGVPGGVPVITCAARIERGKSIAALVRALDFVPDAHVVLAGREDNAAYASEVDELAASLGVAHRVHRLGHLDEVPSLLAASDVFVLPTGHGGEGCPVALLEAMAAGVACVATDVPGSRDLVQSGRSGLLVDVDDVHAMASSIRRLLADPEFRGRLAAAGQARVRDHFSIERETRAHEAFYRDVMRRTPVVGSLSPGAAT